MKCTKKDPFKLHGLFGRKLNRKICCRINTTPSRHPRRPPAGLWSRYAGRSPPRSARRAGRQGASGIGAGARAAGPVHRYGPFRPAARRRRRGMAKTPLGWSLSPPARPTTRPPRVRMRTARRISESRTSCKSRTCSPEQLRAMHLRRSRAGNVSSIPQGWRAPAEPLRSAQGDPFELRLIHSGRSFRPLPWSQRFASARPPGPRGLSRQADHATLAD